MTTKKAKVGRQYRRRIRLTKKAVKKTLPKECLEGTLVPFESRLAPATAQTSERATLREIRQALKPSKIEPAADFYSYINDRWIKEYKIPEKHRYIVQQDDFRIVQDKVYRQLLELTREYLRTPKGRGSALGRSMHPFFQSQQRNCTREQSRRAADEYMAVLDAAPTHWDFMGHLCKNEIIAWGSPFVWSLNPDDRDPATFRCCIDGPQATLIDLDLYFDDLPGSAAEKAYRARYKARYLRFIRDLFKNVWGAAGASTFSAEDVFQVEYELLMAMGCNKVRNLKTNPDNYYRIHDNAADRAAYAPFDWGAFSHALGFTHPPEFFITSNPNYLKCGAELVAANWQTPKWRSYWAYVFIRQQQRWAEGGHTLFYEFHGKYVRGQDAEVFDDIKPVFGLGFAFNTFLTNAYIAKYENPAHVAYVRTMAEDLKEVFTHIVGRNTWLQPATKAAAIKKLRHFNLTVASPPALRPDPLLAYCADNPWRNLCMLAEWRARQAVTLEGHPAIDVPVMDWAQIPPKFVGTQAYVVNAAYTPSKNGIYIPLGYIQPPFVDLEERGIEYNLSHIGFTLAHEMSHALDDWGSRYDYLGRLGNWWTAADAAHFKRIQSDVIRQYEAFARKDGIVFDAAPSIGEDLADISGLAICAEYLRDFQRKNADILPIKVLSFEAFFVYFAFQQRQKISKRAIQAQLKTNPHPLDKYRTNVPLSRLEIFRTLYKIRRGDGMWWPSTNRVWS
jgi:predicted metalloendopeptidase